MAPEMIFLCASLAIALLCCMYLAFVVAMHVLPTLREHNKRLGSLSEKIEDLPAHPNTTKTANNDAPYAALPHVASHIFRIGDLVVFRATLSSKGILCEGYVVDVRPAGGGDLAVLLPNTGWIPPGIAKDAYVQEYFYFSVDCSQVLEVKENFFRNASTAQSGTSTLPSISMDPSVEPDPALATSDESSGPSAETPVPDEQR